VVVILDPPTWGEGETSHLSRDLDDIYVKEFKGVEGN